MLVKTEGFDVDVTWVPFIDEATQSVGWVCRHPDGREVVIKLQPSGGGEGMPDVFLYHGETPVTFVCPNFDGE